MTTTSTGQVYAVVVEIHDGPASEPRMEWVEAWPKTLEGIITATNRASYLSLNGGGPHEIHAPDGRMIARYVGGRRADLPPGGIIHMTQDRAAEMGNQ